MLETDIEAYLVDKVGKIHDGIAYKLTSPNRRFVPDRLCILDGGVTWFVEVKSPTGKLTSGQERELRRLRDLGQNVAVVYSKEEVDELITEMGEL